MHSPAPASPAATPRVTMEKDHIMAGETCVHTLDELVAALHAQNATVVDLRIGEGARENYERVGKVVYGLNRHGFKIADIDVQGDGVIGH